MIADSGLLDLVYLCIFLGNMVLIAILWRVMPWLPEEEIWNVNSSVTDHHIGMHFSPDPSPPRIFSYALLRSVWHRCGAGPQHTLLR